MGSNEPYCHSTHGLWKTNTSREERARGHADMDGYLDCVTSAAGEAFLHSFGCLLCHLGVRLDLGDPAVYHPTGTRYLAVQVTSLVSPCSVLGHSQVAGDKGASGRAEPGAALLKS